MKRKFLVVFLTVTLLLSSFSGVVMAAEADGLVLLPDSSTVVSIVTPGEIIRYQFVAEHTCIYAFHSISDEDTYAELFDSEGNLLFFNDDFYGLNFGIECLLEEGKTYVLEVCFLDTEAEGDFDLITSTNHDVVSELKKVADCNGEGLWKHSCQICGYVWNEVIPPEHNYEGGICVDCGEGMAASGICGDDLNWSFDGTTCTLTISGTGPMYDFEEDSIPWNEYRDLVSSVVVGEGATYIGCSAFSYMPELCSVDLPSSVTEIGDNAFSYCGNLSSIAVPNGVAAIGAFAFSYCDQLTAVSIPGSVSSIAYGAFQGCSSLTQFVVDEENAVYSNDAHGVLFDKAKQCLIQAPAAMKDSYTIPSTVTIIGDSAFEGCARLPAITLSTGITEIGSYAFSGCNSLLFLRIPASVTVIGDDAFSSCDALKGLVFEGDAPTIDGVIFEDISATAYYPSGNQTWTAQLRAECGAGVTWVPIYGLRIVVQPQTKAELIGNTITYVVGAYGKELQYTWWVADSGSNVYSMSCVTDSVYTVEVNSQNIGQKIYCVVKDQSGSVARTQTVTVCAMPELEDDKLTSVTIEAEKEYQYFAYTPKYSCYYTFCSYGDYDTYLELYDAQYNLIAASDDGSDQNFSLRTFMEAGKSYIFGVCAYGQENGTFNVELQSGHDFVITNLPPTCTMTGYTMYTCLECGYSYKVPVGEANGHSWVMATCTTPMICDTCGVIEGDPLGHSYTNGVCDRCGDVKFAIAQKGRTLSYEDLIYVIDIFELTGIEGVDLTKDAGLLIWSVEEFEALSQIAFDADHANVGLTPYKDTDYYCGSSDGIFTRDLHEEAYYVGYVKLPNGAYIYSEAKLYSPAIYATTMLGKSTTSAATKNLCVALLNYISAAQVYFHDAVETELVNYTLTDAQKTLVWNDSLALNLAPTVPSNKQVTADTTVFTTTGKNLLFEEMISLTAIFKINDSIIADAKDCGTIFWTADQFNALSGKPSVTNYGNGTKVELTQYRSTAGQWCSHAPELAAKEMADTQYYFMSYVVHADGTVSYSGVSSYTIETYINKKADLSTDMGQFAIALYHYERAAKLAIG